jgi:hypothetical protein
MNTVQLVDPDQLVEAVEAAKLLHIKPQTVAAWRSEGRGPKYIKVGRRVFYLRSHLGLYLAARVVIPGAVL